MEPIDPDPRPNTRVEFNIDGKPYVYKGAWHPDIQSRIGDAMTQYSDLHPDLGYPTFEAYTDYVIGLLELSGATDIVIHSTREDGTIRWWDLEELIIQ